MSNWSQRQPVRRGPAPTPPVKPATAKPEVRRRRGRVLYRMRRQLAPWAILVGLSAVAGFGQLVSWATGTTVGTTLATFAGFGTLGVAAVVFGRRVPPRWRLRAAVGAASGAMWLPWAAEAFTWSRFAVILPAFLALKAKHDRTVRIPNPTVPPPPQAKAIPTEIPECWSMFVGVDGGPASGTFLSNPRREEHEQVRSIVYDGHLVRGRQSIDTLMAALPLIESGLDIPREKLVLERHPSNRPAMFQFRVIEASPMMDRPVYFQCPQCRGGYIYLGPYTDGQGWAPWKLFTDDSMWGGMVIGGIGVGKSRMLELICISAVSTGLVVPIFIDGQDGSSSPALARNSYEFFRRGEADIALAALEAVQAQRQHDMYMRGDSGFEPSEGLPGIMVVKDEVHRIYESDTVDRWANLAREGRKFGVAQVDGDQDATLETFIKGVLRDSLQQGNTLGGHTANRDMGSILSHGQFNLFDLPNIPGFFQLLNTGGAGREAPFRGAFLPSRKDREKGRAPVSVPIVDEWFGELPEVGLDDSAEKAWLSVLSGAGTPEAVTAVSDGGSVVPFPGLPDLAVREPSSRDKVLSALEDGPATHGDLMALTGLSDRTVRNVCGDLVAEGVIGKANKQAPYVLVAAEGRELAGV